LKRPRARRCELAGAGRDLLDLDAGTLEIETTRVVVDGQVIESDGKTENAQHVLALDPFTLAVLKVHVEMLNQERKDFGPDYRDGGWLFCWESGKPPHPDTITRRFKKLAAAADLPEIDLHDMRHSYATAGQFRCRGRPEDRGRPDRARQHGVHARHLHPQVDRQGPGGSRNRRGGTPGGWLGVLEVRGRLHWYRSRKRAVREVHRSGRRLNA
jgi:integrase